MPPDSTEAPSTSAAPTVTQPGQDLAASLEGWGFFNVPQLGSEPVRGSGCGADGSLGDAIPDGLWSGFIRSWDGGQLEIDLICIYDGAAAEAMYAQACEADPDTCEFMDPTWALVNETQRYRTVKVSPDARYLAGFSPSEMITDDPGNPDATWSYMESWIVVEDGQATFVWSTAPYG